ncbi:MAG TPA: hypothetical protein VD837_07835 [Terriglobales bacterium]|nr:hypothetical protein [Terriglobales bacterium]
MVRHLPSREMTTPKNSHVGIFWLLGGKLILDTTPINASNPNAYSVTHAKGHLAYWRELQRSGVVPSNIDHDEPPRGRVAYHRGDGQYVIYAVPFILANDAVLKRIGKAMELPEDRTTTSTLVLIIRRSLVRSPAAATFCIMLHTRRKFQDSRTISKERMVYFGLVVHESEVRCLTVCKLSVEERVFLHGNRVNPGYTIVARYHKCSSLEGVTGFVFDRGLVDFHVPSIRGQESMFFSMPHVRYIYDQQFLVNWCSAFVTDG